MERGTGTFTLGDSQWQTRDWERNLHYSMPGCSRVEWKFSIIYFHTTFTAPCTTAKPVRTWAEGRLVERVRVWDGVKGWDHSEQGCTFWWGKQELWRMVPRKARATVSYSMHRHAVETFWAMFWIRSGKVFIILVLVLASMWGFFVLFLLLIFSNEKGLNIKRNGLVLWKIVW